MTALVVDNVGLLATNTASLLTTQSGTAYRYLSATAQINVPF